MRLSLRAGVACVVLFLASLLADDPISAYENETTPAPRWGHVLVHDVVRDELLLFGGSSERGESHYDTWTWKDGVWTRHDVTGPAARSFTGAAFHQGIGAVVVHGGRGNERVTYSDTWAWDGSRWEVLEMESDWNVDHHQVIWDAERAELVGFGGWDGSGIRNETRIWRDRTWKRIETDGPPPRSAFGMAFDGNRGRVVLYGGLWISGQYADTWFWNGKHWNPHTGPYDDSSLDHHAMAWDATRGELVTFGGKDYRYTTSDRTRVLSDKVWSERSREGPVARHSTPLTWNESRRTVMMFGGKQYEGEQFHPLGGLWEWNGEVWKEVDGSVRGE